ncbi:MAG: alpha/beta hydrolase [Clostridiales bacterium]|nr:alpha/beta hydrolase [Clostridiales bacterium]
MRGPEEQSFKGSEDANIYYYRWNTSDNLKARGVVLILHGMAEHALRYDDFANFLNEHGFIVYADDHRGHGKTGKTAGKLGYFGDGGWDLLVEDTKTLVGIIKSSHKDLPVILFGHSMGSILAKTCIHEYGDEFDGVILSGSTNGVGIVTRKLGLFLSQIVSLLTGREKVSKLMESVSFGSYNKGLGNLSPFEWLSRDRKVIQDYMDDELCGFTCTAGFYRDMLDGINRNAKAKNISKTPKNLPMFIISGTMDPVGNFTKDIREIYNLYKNIANLENIKCKLYDGARHELLNELNKDEVYNDILKWLNQVLA